MLASDSLSLITGSLTLSLKNRTVPLSVFTVSVVECRIGLNSCWSKLVKLASWMIKTTSATPMTTIIKAMSMIKMSRTWETT